MNKIFFNQNKLTNLGTYHVEVIGNSQLVPRAPVKFSINAGSKVLWSGVTSNSTVNPLIIPQKDVINDYPSWIITASSCTIGSNWTNSETFNLEHTYEKTGKTIKIYLQEDCYVFSIKVINNYANSPSDIVLWVTDEFGLIDSSNNPISASSSQVISGNTQFQFNIGSESFDSSFYWPNFQDLADSSSGNHLTINIRVLNNGYENNTTLMEEDLYELLSKAYGTTVSLPITDLQ